MRFSWPYQTRFADGADIRWIGFKPMAETSSPHSQLPRDQQLADYAMVFDMLGQLTGIRNEEGTVESPFSD